MTSRGMGDTPHDPHASWYSTLRAELAALGLPAPAADDAVDSARSEAAAAAAPPESLFGPATIYARELVTALRCGSRPAPLPSVPGEVVLRLDGVSATRSRRPVLTAINLEVRRGEVVAVVGANGAGKSTLLQICAGILRPTEGRVERTARFGYAPQSHALAPLLTVDEHCRLFGAARGMSARRAVAVGHGLLAGLGWRARGAQSAGTLSGGTQQKLNLALAQIDSPDLLLLDEPYQGFDSLAYEDLWGLVEAWRSGGAGILLVTHLLRDLDHVDRVIELPSPESARGVEHAGARPRPAHPGSHEESAS